MTVEEGGAYGQLVGAGAPRSRASNHPPICAAAGMGSVSWAPVGYHWTETRSPSEHMRDIMALMRAGTTVASSPPAMTSSGLGVSTWGTSSAFTHALPRGRYRSSAQGYSGPGCRIRRARTRPRAGRPREGPLLDRAPVRRCSVLPAIDAPPASTGAPEGETQRHDPPA